MVETLHKTDMCDQCAVQITKSVLAWLNIRFARIWNKAKGDHKAWMLAVSISAMC